MHFIHCFLTKLPEEIIARLYAANSASKIALAVEDAKASAESEVLSFLEGYENVVYDWYVSPCDEEWDRRDVPGYVMGFEEPDQLKNLVAEHSLRPIENAKMFLNWFFKEVNQEKVEITEDALEKIWDHNHGSLNPFWMLSKAMKLAFQEYISECGFYSCPDSSTKISAGILEEIRKNPGAFVLVFIDIHA